MASSGGVAHGLRVALLRDQILPRLIHDPNISEVFVVGEYESGAGYTYIASPSERFDCTDALTQRQKGFDATSGSQILFCHDDHMIGPTFVSAVMQTQGFDVLVPSRVAYDKDENTWRELNNGAAEGYVMGHACVMNRKACEKVPWDSVEKVFTWDQRHTSKLYATGCSISWAPRGSGLVVTDLEAQIGATPWR